MGPSTPLQSCTSSSRTTIPSAPSRPGPTTSSSSLTGTTGTSSSESSRSTSMLSRTDRRSLTSLETLLTLPTSSASVPPTCLRGSTSARTPSPSPLTTRGKLPHHRVEHRWRPEAGRQAVPQRWHRRKEHRHCDHQGWHPDVEVPCSHLQGQRCQPA